jgi:predicted nucleic acid-binding protein
MTMCGCIVRGGAAAAERQNFSIYDGLIVAAAVRAGCTILYTEDLQQGQMIEKLQIRNPFGGH